MFLKNNTPEIYNEKLNKYKTKNNKIKNKNIKTSKAKESIKEKIHDQIALMSPEYKYINIFRMNNKINEKKEILTKLFFEKYKIEDFTHSFLEKDNNSTIYQINPFNMNNFYFKENKINSLKRKQKIIEIKSTNSETEKKYLNIEKNKKYNTIVINSIKPNIYNFSKFYKSEYEKKQKKIKEELKKIQKELQKTKKGLFKITPLEKKKKQIEVKFNLLWKEYKYITIQKYKVKEYHKKITNLVQKIYIPNENISLNYYNKEIKINNLSIIDPKTNLNKKVLLIKMFKFYLFLISSSRDKKRNLKNFILSLLTHKFLRDLNNLKNSFNSIFELPIKIITNNTYNVIIKLMRRLLVSSQLKNIINLKKYKKSY